MDESKAMSKQRPHAPPFVSSGTSRDESAPLVVIVDDDDDVRDALQELLASVSIDSVAYCSPEKIRNAVLPDQPGCLILDIRMPGQSGMDLYRELSNRGENKPVIFVTGHGDIPMSVQAMRAGAVDFLTKPVREQSLLDAVAAAINSDIEKRASDRVKNECSQKFSVLTPREREVMREMALGKLNKQIAFELGISEVTVKLHRGNLMRKMGTRYIGELIRAWDVLPKHVREAG